MKRSKAKPYTRMNAAELAGRTADLDREMAADEFKPLSKRERERWTKARRRPGRPRRGRGAKVISVSVEKGLLSVADALAKSLGITRAGLIERGLKAVLAAEGRL